MTISTMYSEPVTPPPSPTLYPTPSVPPARTIKKTLYIFTEQFEVDVPQDMDVYEALRRWYPSLYEAVLEEEAEMRRIQDEADDLDDYEEFWNQVDYREWIED
jgi:hypothetical protein